MGRKRKSQSIKTKRANAAAAALADEQVERILSKQVETKPNKDLFVIDTKAASNHALSFIPKEDRVSKKKFDKKHISDAKKVKRLIQTYGEDGVEKLAEEGAIAAKSKRRRMRRVAGTARTNFDLWGDNGGNTKDTGKKGKIVLTITGQSSAAGTAPITLHTASKVTNTPQEEEEHQNDKDAIHPSEIKKSNKLIKNRNIAKSLSKPTVPVELAHGGQSYNPDENQHQDVIGEALSIELKREEALRYKAIPISNGLSKETLAILVPSSDEENSESEDDSDDDDDDDNSENENNSSFKPRPKKSSNTSTNPAINRENKKTRAQRNKQKRVKAENAALKKRRTEKSFLHEVNQVKQHAKEIQQKEKEQKERSEYIKQVKEEKKKEPLGVALYNKLSEVDPIRVPSLPVALTSELGKKQEGDEEEEGGDQKTSSASLRKLRPKGSLLTERSESMVSRKMVNRKKEGRKYKVHGKKRKMKGGKGREYLLV